MTILVFEILLAAAPPGRVFGMDAQTVLQALAHLINLGILAFVLAKLLYKPVRKVLGKRTERIQGQIAQAEEDMAKAVELKLQYEQKLEEVQQERDDILAEARKLASEASQRLIAEAKKEADALKERAAANVELEWERAEAEMKTAIIEISSVMAEKFITLAMNKDTQDRIYEETMADLGRMTWIS